MYFLDIPAQQVLRLLKNCCKESIQSYSGGKILINIKFNLPRYSVKCVLAASSQCSYFQYLLEQDTHNVRSVCFHPCGDYLLAGSTIILSPYGFYL